MGEVPFPAGVAGARLTADQMARMSRLLDGGLPADADACRAWLAALAPEDADLRPSLAHALLAGAGAASSDLTLPRILPTPPPAAGLLPGDRVGPYELVRALGAGGMAEVWLAHRADGALRRNVALKLPAISSLRRDIAPRFARERDILAALDHPNIARFYDAGVSPEGLPFLAMEFVPDSRPITAWCDERRMGLRERLALFLQVLDAVRYAHASQVLHRDIKPSNILVTGAGQVRLLDFGVAKLLGGDPSTGHATTTVFGNALTPEYASPEQLLGEPVDARSDVWSLGVVLFELLAGERPLAWRERPARTLLGPPAEGADAPAPSACVGAAAAQARNLTPERLARRLRGDLDAILARALARDPAERYSGPAEFALDIERHLASEPVRARDGVTTYRLRKAFWRYRNRAAAGAAGVFVAALALVGPVWNPAREAPPASVESSIAVLPFRDLSEGHDQEYFSDGLTDELIERLSHGTHLRVVARSSSFQFKGRSEDVRAIAGRLGVDHVLEGSVRRSGRVLRVSAQLVRATDGASEWSQTWDRGVGDVFQLQDEISDAAARSLRVALSRDARLRSGGTVNLEAYTLLLQANHFQDRTNQADNEKAIGLYRDAIALDPDYAQAWCRLGEAYVTQLGFSWAPFVESGRNARAALQRALEIDPDLARAHYLLGQIHRKVDWDWDRASAEYRRALEIDPQDLRSRAGMTIIEVLRGRFQEHTQVREEMIRRDPLDLDSIAYLGWVYYYAGRNDDAVREFRKLAGLAPYYASAQAMLGLTLALQGHGEEGLETLRKDSSARARDELLPVVLWKLGRKAESTAALDNAKMLYPTGSSFNMALSHAYRGERDAAFEWLEKAYRERDPGILWLRIEPPFDSLRGDPRYVDLLRRLHLDG